MTFMREEAVDNAVSKVLQAVRELPEWDGMEALYRCAVSLHEASDDEGISKLWLFIAHDISRWQNELLRIEYERDFWD